MDEQRKVRISANLWERIKDQQTFERKRTGREPMQGELLEIAWEAAFAEDGAGHNVVRFEKRGDGSAEERIVLESLAKIGQKNPAAAAAFRLLIVSLAGAQNEQTIDVGVVHHARNIAQSILDGHQVNDRSNAAGIGRPGAPFGPGGIASNGNAQATNSRRRKNA